MLSPPINAAENTVRVPHPFPFFQHDIHLPGHQIAGLHGDSHEFSDIQSDELGDNDLSGVDNIQYQFQRPWDPVHILQNELFYHINIHLQTPICRKSPCCCNLERRRKHIAICGIDTVHYVAPPEVIHE